ncbi:MAG: sensor histidine kinase [Clostridiaceae bacterium]|nr:sensor histidine kinase [Clostridiaceae bacterium]
MKRELKSTLLLLLFVVTILVSFQSNYIYGETEKRSVLLLNSYNKGFQWTDDIVNAIEDHFKETLYNYELMVEYMDTKLLLDDAYLDKLFQLYQYKYKDTDFDVIIVSDDDALNFLLKYEIFNDVPIVFCGINYYLNYQQQYDFITGVVEDFDGKSTIEVMLQLHPDTSEIVIINDRSLTGMNNKRQLEGVIPEFSDTVEFRWFQDYTMEELKVAVGELEEGSLILLMTYNTDAKGRFHSYDNLIENIYSSTSAPIYSVWDMLLGKGMVGGKLIGGRSQGEMAAALAERILNGESPKDIPIVMESPTHYMFDYNVLKEFDISTQYLPDESILINKPYQFYYENRELFLSIGIFILILMVIIAILISINIKKKQAEKRLKEEKEKVNKLNEVLEEKVVARTAELEFSNQQLRDTVKILRETQDQLVESERMGMVATLVAGVAHEINTPVGVGITTTTYLQERLKENQERYQQQRLRKKDLEIFFQKLQEGLDIMYNNLTRASSFIKSFKQVAIDQTSEEKRIISMKQYLEEIVSSLKPVFKGRRVKVMIHCSEDLRVIGTPGDFYQIITNFIVNSLEHGYLPQQEGNIEISFYQQEEQLILQYKDDGGGIPKEHIDRIFEIFYTTNRSNGGSGLGLNIVHSIVTKKLIGSLECQSEVGKGVVFTIKFPYSKNI